MSDELQPAVQEGRESEACSDHDQALKFRKVDATSTLRALAHPLRVAMLEHLVVRGDLTASQLAESLNENASNCSWHLRKLAEHGLVEEAPTTGGRRRPWRASADGLNWDPSQGDDEFVGAHGEVQNLIFKRYVERFLTTASHLSIHRDPEWEAVSTFHQGVAWLTSAELGEVHDKLQAVLRGLVTEYGDRMSDVSKRPSGARLVEVMGSGAFVHDPLLQESKQAGSQAQCYDAVDEGD